VADRGKTRIVDGYTALKAAQRRAQQDKASPADATGPPTHSPPEEASKPKAIGTHIGRTVMPTKYDIVCYACGFEFKMTGKARTTLCSKCKTSLDLTDHAINGPFDGEIITAGKVHITAGAVLNGGRITANDVLLEGTQRSGEIVAHKTLELAPGALFSESGITARNLRIAAGASFMLKKTARLRDLDVCGELRAEVESEGVVTIRSGGCLKGTVKGAHLVVEDGGGLWADVHIQPAAVDRVEEA